MSQYNNNNWSSLFIPAMPIDIANEVLITKIVENVLGLGKTKRIDIVKKQSPSTGYMAFIHLDHWYDNAWVHTFRREINSAGFCDYTLHNNYGDSKLFAGDITRSIVMRFMQNTTPIKDTELNIHQLAANQEILEKTVKEQSELIETLRKELEQQKAMLNNMYTSIHTPMDDSYIPLPLSLDDLTYPNHNDPNMYLRNLMYRY